MNDFRSAIAAAIPKLTLAEPPREPDEGFRIRDERDERAGARERRGKKARKRVAAMARLEDPRVAAVGRFVRDEFKARPVVATAVAVGLGFVIGGGLSTRFGRTMLTTIARYALRELLTGARV